MARQNYAQLREHYRQLETFSQAVEKERDKLVSVVQDRDLEDSKQLKEERDSLQRQLDDAQAKEKVHTLRAV